MKIRFLNDNGDFALSQAENISGLYFPLANENGMKSAVTPNLGGDSKLDQESFLLEPVSIENLHNNRSTRNFWCVTENGIWSAAGTSARQEADKFTSDQDENLLTAGLMWQNVQRVSKKYGLKAEITSFVPVGDTLEIMLVSITNTEAAEKEIIPIAAVPIYGRSADNLRDHRSVTSMLHRTQTCGNGVLVTPTMSFDEKGHRINYWTYFVLGCEGGGEKPDSFYPTVDQYLGEGGTFLNPGAVRELLPGSPAGLSIAGKESMGGLRFSKRKLPPESSANYIILMGITEHPEQLPEILKNYGTWEQVQEKLAETKRYWGQKVNIRYYTGSEDFDRFMRWVSFQPFLRRIYGCSFLPHHDYGRGGRGWRDLWQDCLALLLMDPSEVHDMITANFGGVRIDGTNATIIGSRQGEFVADRNGIARVWMDHALWPYMTTRLYIDQTGDISILDEKAGYFKDTQSYRGTGIDPDWDNEYGQELKTVSGEIYRGSILEHLLIEHLTAFCEVGTHNIYRLRGADWNDALDMASEKGESVAFTCAYAGNLLDLAELIRKSASVSSDQSRTFAAEILTLLELNPEDYGNKEKKASILQNYLEHCRHELSGKKTEITLESLASALESRGLWLMDHIRKQEWITGEKNDEGWFNSYYDNHGNPVEGFTDTGVRMMLTGQVFAIRSGTADKEQIKAIVRSADRYLYQKETGGYRLNTNFHELKFDMGRMFGFAYGEKENGAVFSHMTVMFANALYRRDFVREGYKALQSLADTALDFEKSKIYPGIPEYFNAEGRGLYHYLTGAASWYMMTIVNEVFGCHGSCGNLVIRPKLVKEQFDKQGNVSISFPFSGKNFHVFYENKAGMDYDVYRIRKAEIMLENGLEKLSVDKDGTSAVIPQRMIRNIHEQTEEIMVKITLG